jgi:UDP-N-acetylglucosamine 1-carboxyvinyltransferase
LDTFVVNGGRTLSGEVLVGGSKNASLPILAATVLAEGPSSIGNVPRLADIDTLSRIMRNIGVDVSRGADGRIACEVTDEEPVTAPYDLVRRMRASICVLGPLVAKRGRARVSLPGGCVIGARPIDLHLKGLRALGAKVQVERGYVIAEAEGLRGARVYLGGSQGPSVLGTATTMTAATLAEGETVIEHAACEPEIEDLAGFLTACGASIEGAGTHRIRVRGVERLAGARYDVMPDRIEAGTFLMAAAITGGEVLCRGARAEHLDAVLDGLAEAGVKVVQEPAGRASEACGPAPEGLRVLPTRDGRPRRTDLTALPYPGFPTDLQAQMTALLSVADGASVVTDRVFPDRFIHAQELNRLGASITRRGDLASIQGVRRLRGATVTASDLRASAALVLAALAAEGETVIRRIYHLDRGYERFEEKLRSLGADIRRVPESEVPVSSRHTRRARGSVARAA